MLLTDPESLRISPQMLLPFSRVAVKSFKEAFKVTHKGFFVLCEKKWLNPSDSFRLTIKRAGGQEGDSME